MLHWGLYHPFWPSSRSVSVGHEDAPLRPASPILAIKPQCQCVTWRCSTEACMTHSGRPGAVYQCGTWGCSTETCITHSGCPATVYQCAKCQIQGVRNTVEQCSPAVGVAFNRKVNLALITAVMDELLVQGRVCGASPASSLPLTAHSLQGITHSPWLCLNYTNTHNAHNGAGSPEQSSAKHDTASCHLHPYINNARSHLSDFII